MIFREYCSIITNPSIIYVHWFKILQDSHVQIDILDHHLKSTHFCHSSIDSSQEVWFGLERNNLSDPWKWVDGTPFVLHNSDYYQVWYRFDPSGDLCTRMLSWADYKWGDKSCLSNFWTFCERTGKLNNALSL